MSGTWNQARTVKGTRGPMGGTRRLRWLGAAAGSLLLGTGLALATAASASGQGVGPVTVYADYPAPLPTGCPDGPAALIGVVYTNGRGGEQTDLRRLDVRNGDVLTMTWADFAGGCKGADGEPAIAVSMAAYDAGSATFDSTIDQRLLPGWSTCGAGGPACQRSSGRYQLTVTIPGTDVTCAVQTGAIIGLPLAVVGPNGSYYSSVLRVDDRPNMLIGATNFGAANCAPVATTTTAAVAPTTVTTTAEVVASTVQPTTTAAAASPVAVEAAEAQLPMTGRTVDAQVWFGLGLAFLGTGLLGAALVVSRRPRLVSH